MDSGCRGYAAEIDYPLIEGDASLMKEKLGDYNYFFIQNSFVGKIFDAVIKNIQNAIIEK